MSAGANGKSGPWKCASRQSEKEQEKREAQILSEQELSLANIELQRDARIEALNLTLEHKHSAMAGRGRQGYSRERLRPLTDASPRSSVNTLTGYRRPPKKPPAKPLATWAGNWVDLKPVYRICKGVFLRQANLPVIGSAQFGLRIPGPVGSLAGLLAVHGGDVVQPATAGSGAGGGGIVINNLTVQVTSSSDNPHAAGRAVADGMIDQFRIKGLAVPRSFR